MDVLVIYSTPDSFKSNKHLNTQRIWRVFPVQLKIHVNLLMDATRYQDEVVNFMPRLRRTLIATCVLNVYPLTIHLCQQLLTCLLILIAQEAVIIHLLLRKDRRRRNARINAPMIIVCFGLIR